MGEAKDGAAGAEQEQGSDLPAEIDLDEFAACTNPVDQLSVVVRNIAPHAIAAAATAPDNVTLWRVFIANVTLCWRDCIFLTQCRYLSGLGDPDSVIEKAWELFDAPAVTVFAESLVTRILWKLNERGEPLLPDYPSDAEWFEIWGRVALGEDGAINDPSRLNWLLDRRMEMVYATWQSCMLFIDSSILVVAKKAGGIGFGMPGAGTDDIVMFDPTPMEA